MTHPIEDLHADRLDHFGTSVESATPSEMAGPIGSRTWLMWFNERAEGVISTAISVLIIAFLGIALWTGFQSMMNGATDKTRAQVEQIGN